MNTTPASLLVRLRRPEDHEAWARFVQLYTPLLLHWASQWGLQSADAADLVQEVFVSLVRSLPTFEYDGRRSFRGWLHTVVRHKWIELRRGRGRLPADDDGLSSAAAADHLAALEQAEFNALLAHRALELIEGEFRPSTLAAFRAVVLDDRPAAEVAAELGLTVNAVYLARNRVLRRLRDELEGMWE
ncbi:MAG: RNA polymerase sigma factor [Pirellulales bacterium]